MVSVRTKNKPIRNPCLNYNYSPIKTQFIIDFYSWENITSSNKKNPNYAYMRIDITNMNPAPTLTYIL